MSIRKAFFHLPGLFEFYNLYSCFIPLFYSHREYFYDWCEIGSVYGAPSDCIWGGGRIETADTNVNDIITLLNKYKISARLTFSNSLLKEEHLKDSRCNTLCQLFSKKTEVKNGIIIYSDILLNYIKSNYPEFYFVSSTTKVITDFNSFIDELKKDEYTYVVPDFRLNKDLERLEKLPASYKSKIEFLCNECCDFKCENRKRCYEDVSCKMLGIEGNGHVCTSLSARQGYKFSEAMKNKGFISKDDIKNIYLPQGFSNFKVEGRGLGSALIFEMLLYYMTKPEYYINVREHIYLDNMLDLF